MTTSDASLSGLIWDDEVPQFANHSYRYKIQHSHVAVKSKMLMDKGYWLTPWISGSLGVGYEFADWGQSRLGRAAEQTLNNGLELNHLYINGILFNLTYCA